MWNRLKKIDWKKISLYIFLSTLLIGLVALTCNVLFIDIINFYLPKIFIYITNIIFFLVVFYLYQDGWKKKIKSFKYFTSLEKTTKYIFLGSLLIIIFVGFENFLTQWQDKIIISNIFSFIAMIKNWQIILTIIAVISGFFVFFVNREKIEKEIEKEKINEEKAEEKRYTEFENKFPKINKICGLKNITRWIYKENWKYIIGLMGILIIGSLVLSFNIADSEFKEDEFQVVLAATGFLNTGNFYRWDWLNNDIVCNDLTNSTCYYDRAWPHSAIIALSYKLFGISEWSSRIVSVFFGLLFLICSYFITKYFFKNKKLSILITITLLLNPAFINFFRYTRMYALLAPLFLILFYLSYRFITESKDINFKNKTLNKIINKNFNFNFIILLLLFIFLFLNSQIHINSLLIVPSLYLFVIYLAITHKKRRYFLLTGIGFLAILIIFLAYHFNFTTKYIGLLSFFGKNNYMYLDHLTQYPFKKTIGIIFLIIFLLNFPLFRNKLRDKLTFFYITTLFSLFFMIWIGNRYAGFLYISHIATLSIILIITSCYFVIKLYKSKILNITFLILLSLFIGFNFFQNSSKLYSNKNTNYGKFKEAYPTIINNFDNNTQIIFGQYLRNYYLKDAGIKKSKIINMLNNKKYLFKNFKNDLSKYNSGYITWETRKSYHIKKDIIEYCCNNFTHLHGEKCKQKIDDTKVEIFYYSQNMVK